MKAPVVRESTIEKAVCDFARKHGCLVMKLAAPNQKGQPDRMFLKDGKAVFIEFKAPGQQPTALQWRWIKLLQGQGFTACWVDNARVGIDFLKLAFGIP